MAPILGKCMGVQNYYLPSERVIGMPVDNCITTRGTTVQEAVQKALKVLDIPADQARVEVLREARQGFLGFCCKPAKVKVTIKEETKVERELIDILVDLDIGT